MHGLSRAAALAVKMGWIRSRRWQGQTVALIHKRDGWVGSWRHPWAGEAAASQQGHNSLRAENRSCKIHCIFSLFFFFPPTWMGINPWTCSQGKWPDAAS